MKVFLCSLCARDGHRILGTVINLFKLEWQPFKVCLRVVLDGIMFAFHRKMCAQTPMKLLFYTCVRRFINKIENAKTHLLIGSFNYSPSCTVALLMLQYLQTLCLHMYSSTLNRLAVVHISLYVIYSVQHRGGLWLFSLLNRWDGYRRLGTVIHLSELNG